jgi:flagellar hook-associated protein 1 FlgK
MVSFTSKILSNSVSSMTTQQALLANASNNIANVNTPGYTRRQIDVSTRADPAMVDGVLRVGSGVQLGEISRITNQFLETSLRNATSSQGQAVLRNDFLARVESLFSLDGPHLTVGTALNNLFSSINQVGVDPSNLDLRLDVMQKADDLITVISSTFNEIAAAQNDLNLRVQQDIEGVNSLTQQIAKLNSFIGQREAAGVPAIDERDQRDVLLNKLAERVSFKTLETGSGMINCYLENGFPLVSEGTARSLTFTTTPSFATGPLPPSLNGGVLGYVVYNFGTETNPSHLDLTKVLKAGQGSVGAALQLRGHAEVSNTSAFEADGELVQMATRIEAIARSLLTTVNQVYRGADEDPGTVAFEPSSADLNGNIPGVFGLFDFDYSGVKDADGDGLASNSDLTASGLNTFSNRLKLGFSSATEFAAARDSDSNPGSTAFVGGDGRNALALSALRTQVHSFNLGSVSFTGTYDEMYNAAVSTIGSFKSAAQNDFDVASANFNVASVKRDEFSSVSLDEEFANVIKFQKAFQASARMIRTASEILDTVVALI